MPEPQPIKFTQAPDFRENYANSTATSTTLWDFQLIFGFMRAASEGGMAVENFQRITMSPQQAKALVNVLSQNVQQYEAAFGEIKLQQQMAVGGVIQ